MEKSFPFDAVEIEGVPDRVYAADDFAMYFRQFISNGVYPNPSNGLQVVSTNSMVVRVCTGSAFAQGYSYAALEYIDIAIDSAHMSYNRKDIVVVRLDLTGRTFRVLYRPGTAGSNPQPPALMRTDDIYDLQLAEIAVRTNASAVLTSDILDTRLDKTKCGICAAVVSTVDTTTLFNQYQSYFNQQIAAWDTIRNQQSTAWQGQTQQQQDDWDTWFATINLDIQNYATFNFDNLAALSGVTRLTTFSAAGITEAIRLTGTGTLVAQRVTSMMGTSLSAKETLFLPDGTSVSRTSTVTTTFPAGGIQEVVTI